MFFSPIILTPFHPYFCNFVPQPISFPELPQVPETHQVIDTLTCAAQKFQQLISEAGKEFSLALSTDYMNLSLKNSHLKLQPMQQFVSFYNEVINRYKFSYKNSKIKYSWSQQDITILLWLTNWLYHKKETHPTDFDKEDWLLISSMVPFRSGEDCMYKWLSLRNNQLQQFPWTQIEKEELALLVQSNQNVDWVDVSRKLFEKFSKKYRTPKQCKESWSIILSCRFERSKKFWSSQQDTALLEAFSRFGRKWKQIASLIEGRSENAIKNRFTLLSEKFMNKKNTNRFDKDLILLIQAKMLEQNTQGSNQS